MNIFLEWDEVVEICKNCGLHHIPIIFKGKLRDKNELYNLIPKGSAYGKEAERVVVFNYKKQVRGKVVKSQS